MIKTLIIMTTYGQIFYSKEAFFDAQTGDTDISLTAGLISAIYSMTTETQKQKITELELENDRSVFNELPGEKLFIITVDKRMDASDADDMLADMSKRFMEKYGEIQMDGLILSDFEPIADEIVEDRLWYNTVPPKPNKADFLVFLFLLATMIWYPYWLLDGENLIIDRLKEAYDDGFGFLILYSILFGVVLTVPITVSVLLLKRYKNLSLPFRYASEFLRRPTRGGYSEVLPSWFLFFPILISAMFVTTVRYARGIQYGLSIQPIGYAFDGVIQYEGRDPLIPYFWQYVFGFLFFYLLTWYILLPVIVGLFTGDLSLQFLKSSAIIISMAMIVLLPAQIMAGLHFQHAMGFHPDDPALGGGEATTLEYLFTVIVLVNLSLFTYIFMIGVGLSQLVAKNKSRFPIGFGLGLFITMAIQNFIFYLVFNSDLWGFVPIFA